jgi:hypothetical protein
MVLESSHCEWRVNRESNFEFNRAGNNPMPGACEAWKTGFPWSRGRAWHGKQGLRGDMRGLVTRIKSCRGGGGGGYATGISPVWILWVWFVFSHTGGFDGVRILQAWQTRAQHTRAEHNTRAQHTGPSTREQHNTHSTARSTRAHSTRAQHTRTQHACIQSTRTHNTCAQEHTTGLAEHTRTTHARRAQHTPQCSCDKKAKSCDLTIPVLVEGSCRVRVHSPFTSF